MKKNLIFSLIFISLCCSACSDCSEEYSQGYNEGYEEGYQAALEELNLDEKLYDSFSQGEEKGYYEGQADMFYEIVENHLYNISIPQSTLDEIWLLEDNFFDGYMKTKSQETYSEIF